MSPAAQLISKCVNCAQFQKVTLRSSLMKKKVVVWKIDDKGVNNPAKIPNKMVASHQARRHHQSSLIPQDLAQASNLETISNRDTAIPQITSPWTK